MIKMENINKLNTESMYIYALLLNLFETEDYSDEVSQRFKKHIINKINNGENIKGSDKNVQE
ncbi:MAG: hypothetical protein BZ138_08020 [Methanosphaera sp. rholeuAM270]|nr:MAG: hypothetical protein BZ138_08020 [Methanosphaera sp. rholeuAM270]